LHDIVVPSPAPWWPPAPGWYWIIVLLIVGAVWLSLWALLRWQRNRYRREDLKLFAILEKQLSDPSKRIAVVTSLAILLKRAALSAWPRDAVAALTGLPWLKFLDRTGRTDRFSQGPGVLLADVAYDPRGVKDLSDQETRQLAVLVRDWLAHHQSRSS
jgi:hypothetical protein